MVVVVDVADTVVEGMVDVGAASRSGVEEHDATVNASAIPAIRPDAPRIRPTITTDSNGAAV